jgi:hypothetical protein
MLDLLNERKRRLYLSDPHLIHASFLSAVLPNWRRYLMDHESALLKLVRSLKNIRLNVNFTQGK